MTTKRLRDHAELLGLLHEEVYFLESAAERFDGGKAIESKILATRLRVLLHHTLDPDTGKVISHSLLNQLGLQNILTWIDTAGLVDPHNLSTTSGLLLGRSTIGVGGEYVAKCEVDELVPRPILLKDGTHAPPGTRIPFGDWWANDIMKDAGGRTFSRKQLVLALANKEGGAHYDPEVKASYVALAENNSLGWAFDSGNGTDPERFKGNPVMAGVRQIAWEVLESLSQQRSIIDASAGPSGTT